MNYPLPARPQTGPPGLGSKPGGSGVPTPAGASTPAGLHQIPRSPFLSQQQQQQQQQQPQSPKPLTPLSSAFLPTSAANSPGRALASAGPGPSPRARQLTGQGAPPRPAWPPRVTADKLRTNTDLLRFGPGWTVEWRAWTGASVLGDKAGIEAGAGAGPGSGLGPGLSNQTNRYDPTNPTQSNKALGRKLLDELSASHGHGASSRPATPLASSSSHQPPPHKLKHRLELLNAFLGPDPLEAARAQILAAIATHKHQHAVGSASPAGLGASSPPAPTGFGLFAHVEVAQEAEPETAKGKEKQKDYFEDAQAGAARTLWVFRIVPQGVTGLRIAAMPDAAAETTTSLANYDFPELSPLGEGKFTHRDLFPALYPAPPPSPTPSNPSTPAAATPAATSAADQMNTTLALPAPSCIPPLSRPTNSFPSALQLSAALLPIRAGSPTLLPGPPLHKVYDAFLAGANDSILASLVVAGSVGGTVSLRLGETVVALPAASLPFGVDGRRATASAVQTGLRLSVQKEGVMVQAIVEDVMLRAWPVGDVVPATEAPLRLAPFGAEALVVKSYPPLPHRETTAHGTPSQPSLAETGRAQLCEHWDRLLAGTGLSTAGIHETWVLCRISLPPPPLAPTELPSPASSPAAPQPTPTPPPDTLDVLWPASLVVLDGSKPQPARSPTNTPIKAACPLAPEETLVRQNLASATRRRESSGGAPYRDPLAARMDQATTVLQGLEQQERDRAAKERDLAAAKVAAVAASSTTAAAAGEAKGGVAGAPHAGAPVNMRTPISLGGSSTEAPSPADGFGPLERMLGLGAVGAGVGAPIGMNGLAFETAQAADGAAMGMAIPHGPLSLDHLYPSPSDQGQQQPAQQADFGGQGGSLPILAGPIESHALESAFPDFDWGDNFGPAQQDSRNQPSHQGGNEFDDGMMMGLTDDDFSFFDDPVSMPLSLPPARQGLLSEEPSPKFVDHFPHLSDGNQFQPGSPTSPFGHVSPQILAHPANPEMDHHASPNLLLGYPFDPTNNALGLGSATPAGAGPDTHSPFKTPRTPYTPFIELDEDSPAETPAGHALSLAGTPAATLAARHRHGLPTPASRFQPVTFGKSHAKADAKYDPRRGKFGLPSPESESELALLLIARDGARASWWGRVCDPRVAVAGQLKRKRKPDLAKRPDDRTKLTKSAGRDQFAKLLSPRGWVPADHPVQSPHQASILDDSSSDESMGVDETDEEDDELPAERRAEGGVGLDVKFGAALLLLRSHLNTILQAPVATRPVGPKPPLAPAAAKAASAADAALEATVSLVADQVTYNPDYKAKLIEARLARLALSSPTQSVSAQAIELAASRLTALGLDSDAGADKFVAHKAREFGPALATATPPSLLLRAQQSHMQTTPTALQYWRPMAFEPLAGGKDLTAFAVFEDGGSDLAVAVKAWLGAVTEAYESARLGKHAPGSVGSIQDGLAAVPSGALSGGRTKEDLKPTCALLTEAARASKHVVVYVLTPPGRLPTSAQSPVAVAVQQLLKSRAGTMSMVVYPVPLSAVSRSRALGPSGDPVAARLSRLAFSVYDQLLVPVAQLHFPVPETFPTAQHHPLAAAGAPARLFQCPSITLAPARPARLQFELGWPAASLEVEHRHRLLHVAYACVPAGGPDGAVEWVVVCMVDDKGEMWKTLPRLVRFPPSGPVREVIRARAVWSMARMLADAADVEWRLVIAHLGELSLVELRAWEALVTEQLAAAKRPMHVTLCSVDLSPPLSVLAVPGKTAPAGEACAAEDSPEMGEEGEVVMHEPAVVAAKPAAAAAAAAAVPSASPAPPKPDHLDTEPSTFTFTPSEPVTVSAASALVAPASTFLVHVPRLHSLAHARPAAFPPGRSGGPGPGAGPVSVVGVHFLLGKGTRTSSLQGVTLARQVQDVGQSFAELAGLGRARWGASGRVAWHVEAVGQVRELLREVEEERRA